LLLYDKRHLVQILWPEDLSMQATIQIVSCLAISVAACNSASAENWARFRGPNGQGISSEMDLPVEWNEGDNVAWKTSIPGNGWSSPIVYDQHVFLTTATEEGTSCRVICVRRDDGRIAWNTEVHRQVPGRKRRQNSYATPTPVTDGERVYAVFFDGTAVAVDFSGDLVWKSPEVRFFSLHGLGASPLLAEGQLVMPFDGSSRDNERVGWKIPWEQAVVLSLDAATGSVRWKGTRGKSRVGHVTPILVDGGAQIVSAGGDRVQGFNARTGERIWSIYSQGEGVTPSPVVGDGLIFTSSGFEAPTIRAIRLGGKGDVTNSHIVWEQTKGVPVLASPLYVHPHLYTITRDNILHCIEASTGDVVWLRRLSGVHSASPVFADGRIYVLSEEGVTLVLRPGPRYDEVARNSIGETCLASMAVSQGQFYIRSSEHLYCIGESDPS
jgi:outer membrane protein assembly factor BamB